MGMEGRAKGSWSIFWTMSKIEGKREVSVVLPTYNGSKHIRQAIESCLGQTYEHMELIIVDDGSTDDTANIIAAYEDARIVFLRKQSNQGLPAALNAGFENSRGEFLSWISDDNYFAPSALEDMLTFLIEIGGEFVFCDFFRFDENDTSNMQLVRLPDAPGLRRHNDIGPCFMYSRKVFNRVGGYDDLASLVEDYDYWIRVSKAFPMHHLAKALYYYRSRASSLSSRQNEIQIASVFARLRHQLIGPREATSQLIKVLTEASEPSVMGPGNRVMRLGRLVRGYARLAPGIKKVVEDLHMQRIDVRKAQARIVPYVER